MAGHGGFGQPNLAVLPGQGIAGGQGQLQFGGFVPNSLGFAQGPTGAGGLTAPGTSPLLGTDPRSVVGGGITTIGNEAFNLFNQGPQQFFPGQTVAGLNQLQQGAVGGAQGAIGAAQPLFGAALQSAFGTLNPFSGLNPGASALQQTASGQFLQPGTNPFSQQVFDQSIAPSIRNNVNQSFLGAGRFGSPTNTAALTRELGNAANQFFGGTFTAERQNQIQAAQALGQQSLQAQAQAPGLAGGIFQNQLGLFDLGTALQSQQQAQINAQRERFNFGQQAPFNQLQQFQNFINPLNIGQLERANQPSTSGFQDVLQTGTALADIAGTIGSIFR